MKKPKTKTKAKAAPKEVLPDRKVVQVAAAAAGSCWLLCDDGSLWAGSTGNWARANIDQVVFNPPPAADPVP